MERKQITSKNSKVLFRICQFVLSRANLRLNKLMTLLLENLNQILQIHRVLQPLIK